MKSNKEKCILRHLRIKKKTQRKQIKMESHSSGRRITEKDFEDIACNSIINVNQQCGVVKNNIQISI